MKKTIILITAIVLVIVTMVGYKIYSYQKMLEQAEKENKTYQSFYNVQVLGTDIASLMNKIDDSNLNNGVEKDSIGCYIENDTNSIKVDIKFLELDDSIPFEKIEKQGINQFVQNYGALSFKCTKIEYHNATKQIKYMYFEQV